jgi:drug/metabolite transporter (DMT)-like permease
VSVQAWQTRRPLLPELALVAATIAYGGTFKIVQDALEHLTPAGFILLRFIVGTIALTPFALRRGWRRRGSDASPRDFVIAALGFGLVGFAGYWLQNAGLERTTTSNAAFITGLFVVFTPLVETVVTRRAPSRNVLVAVAVSAVGLFLLTGASLQLGAGDALELGCALMFGIWIFMGGTLSQRFDPVALTAAQMVVLSVCAVPVVLVSGLGEITAGAIGAVVFTGVVCSAIAFTLQLWGQRSLEPSRAAVILLFEPVVAGFVGYLVGERLGFEGYVGAIVIFGGILIAESHAWRRGRAELPT